MDVLFGTCNTLFNAHRYVGGLIFIAAIEKHNFLCIYIQFSLLLLNIWALCSSSVLGITLFMPFTGDFSSCFFKDIASNMMVSIK